MTRQCLAIWIALLAGCPRPLSTSEQTRTEQDPVDADDRGSSAYFKAWSARQSASLHWIFLGETTASARCQGFVALGEENQRKVLVNVPPADDADGCAAAPAKGEVVVSSDGPEDLSPSAMMLRYLIAVNDEDAGAVSRLISEKESLELKIAHMDGSTTRDLLTKSGMSGSDLRELPGGWVEVQGLVCAASYDEGVAECAIGWGGLEATFRFTTHDGSAYLVRIEAAYH